MYMNPRGHPPDEHMPYVSVRAHARTNSGWGVVGCSGLSTIIYKINVYVHEHKKYNMTNIQIYIIYIFISIYAHLFTTHTHI